MNKWSLAWPLHADGRLDAQSSTGAAINQSSQKMEQGWKSNFVG